MKPIFFRVLALALAVLTPAAALAEGDGAKTAAKDHAAHTTKTKQKAKPKAKAKAKAKPSKPHKATAPKTKPAKKTGTALPKS